MKFFDPHVHMTSRTTDDYEAMAKAGVVAVLEPAFWMGQPRTHVGTFEDYFLAITGWERFRASQFGIKHYCTMGLNPKESNNAELADAVIDLLPRYLEKENCVGVGEIGYDDMTPSEEKYFAIQLELAKEFDVPVIVHTPHRDKKRGTERTISLIKEVGIKESLVIIDHNTEETLPLTLATGCWAGHSIYPQTKMDEPRMTKLVQEYGNERIIINSAADWGVSDCLKVPKTAQCMLAAGIPEASVHKIVWENPIVFFGQSGKLDLSLDEQAPKVDQTRLYEGNSVLRGQEPRVEH